MPREPRDLSLIDGEYRMGQSDTVSGEAGDQPGAVPILNSAPTYDMLPYDSGDGTPSGLIYYNTSNDFLEIAMPDGSGGVVTDTILDMSASLSLGVSADTGLL